MVIYLVFLSLYSQHIIERMTKRAINSRNLRRIQANYTAPLATHRISLYNGILNTL